jgi:hypothetical protein
MLVLATVPCFTQQYVEYSAKLVCGIQGSPDTSGAPRETVKPGNYATDINIHNPNIFSAGSITFFKRVVAAVPEGQQPAPPTAYVTDTLANGSAIFVDCTTIKGLLKTTATTFITGFVTIVVPPQPGTTELDVVGVYSSEPPPVTPATGGATQVNGISLEVVNVPPRFISPPSTAALPSN